MAPDQSNDSVLMEIAQELLARDPDGVRSMLEKILNTVMRLEREKALGAAPYERSKDRVDYANGFKDKCVKSRMGSLALRVPQTRNGDFYPKSLEKGSRSEVALKAALAEMYLRGVSTRKVTRITEKLCGLEFTSMDVSRATKKLDEDFHAFRCRLLGKFSVVFLDATYLKVRHARSVQSMPCFVAYGIDSEGKRQIIGASMELSEAEVHWRKFLEDLLKRGLSGVKLIVSDDHAGLRSARAAVFPSVRWQRCQFHMTQNALHHVSKRSLQAQIIQTMKDIFSASSLEKARELVQEAGNTFVEIAPRFVQWLEENIEDGFAVFLHPIAHRKRLRTTNGLERVNREIKRRSRVAVLFPNPESALRLVTGVLIEIHEEWVTGKAYLNMQVSENPEQLLKTM